MHTECFWYTVKHQVVCEHTVRQSYMLAGHI